MIHFIKKIFGKRDPVNYPELLGNGALVVDVRTVGEFKEGHINGAINIPLDQIKTNLPALKKRNKPVITCCRSGNRSGMARMILQSAGIECYNGGAWDSLLNKLN